MALADLAEAERIQPVLQEIENLAGQLPDPRAELRLWEEYRQVGVRFRSFYEKLPDRMENGSGQSAVNSSSTETALATDQLLRALDARDALRADSWPLAVFPLQVRTQDDLWIRDPAGQVQLADSATTYQFTLEATSPDLLRSAVSLDYDRDLLDVQPTEGTVEPAPETDPAKKVFRKPTSLLIRARAGPGTGRAVSDTPAGPTGLDPRRRRVTAEHQIDCVLPFPNRVDVLVRPRGLADVRDSGPGATLQLPPNRPVELEVSLANRSGRPRTVLARLWAAPPSPGVPPGHIAPAVRRLIEGNGSETDAGFRAITQATLALPSDGPAVVQFGSSPAQPPAEEKADEKKNAPAPNQPPPKKRKMPQRPHRPPPPTRRNRLRKPSPRT